LFSSSPQLGGDHSFDMLVEWKEDESPQTLLQHGRTKTKSWLTRKKSSIASFGKKVSAI